MTKYGSTKTKKIRLTKKTIKKIRQNKSKKLSLKQKQTSKN
jgi:hypothetical protein